MIDDTGIAHTETYSTVDAMLSAIQGIEEAALTERFDNAPLRLRLLTRSGSGSSDQDFTITPIDTFRGDESYVAVSYAWAHEQSTYGVQIPTYRIWDPAHSRTQPRQPRCPPIIFHRAVRYAQSKGVPYIWIDQECIHQDDDVDRERHLQLMHRIYRASIVTIAILSTHMPNLEVFKEFVEWALDAKETHEGPQALPQGNLADWLMTMTRDRWFTRTWTMQEKLCSSKLEYLIPIPTRDIPSISDRRRHLLVSNDLCIDVENSVANFDMATSPSPGLLTAYQQLGKWLSTSLTRDDLVRNIEFALYEMGPRSNSVLSDRLAILANVCDLRYTLSTTILRDLDVNYRTCLLVLTFANVWPDAEERRNKYGRFAEHELGAGAGEGSPDDILEEFLERPRIGVDMQWIHYDLES